MEQVFDPSYLDDYRIPGMYTNTEWERYKWFHSRNIKNKNAPDEKITLSSMRINLPKMEKGFVRERRAGKYVERKVNLFQKSGGFIRRMKHETLFDGTVVKPYVTLDQISVDVNTGEEFLPPPEQWKFCKEQTSRFSDPKQVKKTCESFKWLIRANEDRIRLFVTLTYAENMTDTKRLYQDYRKFIMKLRYQFPQISGYLVAFEPQKRGAWHAHILLLSNNPYLYISNTVMHRIWGFGFTKTQAVKRIRDVGSYLTSYLTNLKQGEKTKKGARLYMYPRGFHFLRSSHDVNRTTLTRWYGEFDKVNLPGDSELIYDYENVRPLNRERTLYNITKIFCFREYDDLLCTDA
ncbi:MAG: hypothetical protein MJY99_08790 [Fibrobacter sp.]|nr:hypothetical protein [Fibrobacter sp.]